MTFPDLSAASDASSKDLKQLKMDRKASSWLRKITLHSRKRLVARQVANLALPAPVPSPSPSKKLVSSPRKQKTSTLKRFVDALKPVKYCPPPVQIPAHYSRADHSGVVVGGKRVPYCRVMHLNRRKGVLKPMETLAENRVVLLKTIELRELM